MSRPRILVIGSTNTDMVAEVPQLPHAGQTVLGGAFRMTPGGKGANQAIAAARAGGEVTFITAVGDDTFGADSRELFTREGIETRYLFTKPGTPSGVALIMVDTHGENLIAVAPGANAQLTPADLTTAHGAFAGAQMCILQLEIPLETASVAVQRAREVGCPILLNPAPMPDRGLPDDLLAQIDILTPNAGELKQLAPGFQTIDEAARAVLARGVKVLVATMGHNGVVVYTDQGSYNLPALRVHAVDTVGAGDCFSATLGVALAEGRELKAAVHFAITAAGLSTTRPGAQAGMPTRANIESRL